MEGVVETLHPLVQHSSRVCPQQLYIRMCCHLVPQPPKKFMPRGGTAILVPTKAVLVTRRTLLGPLVRIICQRVPCRLLFSLLLVLILGRFDNRRLVKACFKWTVAKE